MKFRKYKKLSYKIMGKKIKNRKNNSMYLNIESSSLTKLFEKAEQNLGHTVVDINLGIGIRVENESK